MRPGLQDIKTLAGPEAVSLGRLTARARQAARQLRGVIPPPDLAPIHALLQSACQMAECGRGDAIQGDRVRRHGYRVERLLGGGGIADAAGAGP